MQAWVTVFFIAICLVGSTSASSSKSVVTALAAQLKREAAESESNCPELHGACVPSVSDCERGYSIAFGKCPIDAKAQQTHVKPVCCAKPKDRKYAIRSARSEEGTTPLFLYAANSGTMDRKTLAASMGVHRDAWVDIRQWVAMPKDAPAQYFRPGFKKPNKFEGSASVVLRERLARVRWDGTIIMSGHNVGASRGGLMKMRKGVTANGKVTAATIDTVLEYFANATGTTVQAMKESKQLKSVLLLVCHVGKQQFALDAARELQAKGWIDTHVSGPIWMVHRGPRGQGAWVGGGMKSAERWFKVDDSSPSHFQTDWFLDPSLLEKLTSSPQKDGPFTDKPFIFYNTKQLPDHVPRVVESETSKVEDIMDTEYESQVNDDEDSDLDEDEGDDM